MPVTRDSRPAPRSGFSDVGNRDGWNPIYRDERTYSLTANLTKIKGATTSAPATR